jgi:hypothetical protein
MLYVSLGRAFTGLCFFREGLHRFFLGGKLPLLSRFRNGLLPAAGAFIYGVQ